MFYTHGENRSEVQNLNNSNYQKQFAALDAVVGPNGTVQCYAATQAATAAAYAGCVPLNPFGPSAVTQGAFAYLTQTTAYEALTRLDDVGGSFSGKAFDGWAGPVQFALSVEGRRNGYKVTSDASPTAVVNCTGLRICSPTLPLYAQTVSAQINASNTVYEGAAELLVPLLAGKRFAENIDLSLAGRFTHYSTSGSVATWKVGLDYRISPDIRLRGTVSRDIRAPTLVDLFQPVQLQGVGFTDQHTGVSNTVFSSSQGNPNLTPEKALTYTVGAVLTPRLIPALSLSFDYYRIRLDNAITSVQAQSVAVQKLCEDSNGTSIYCSLYQRPLPFSDHSAANFPTLVYNFSLNSAVAEIRGFDVEVDYRFARFGGTWTARVLANYQPTNFSQPFVGAAITLVTAPKARVTTSLRFDLGKLGMVAQDNWVSGFSKVSTPGQVYDDPWVRAFNTLDLAIERKFAIRGVNATLFLSVENVLNAEPEAYAVSTSVGQNYPVAAGEDILGRYFTAGLRTNF